MILELLRVLNYDGPGFDKKFINSIENKEIMQILISIWTEYSILDNNNNNDGYAQSSKLADISLFNEKSSFINNSSLGNVTLTDKYEMKPQKLNNTTMIKTQRIENSIWTFYSFSLSYP